MINAMTPGSRMSAAARCDCGSGSEGLPNPGGGNSASARLCGAGERDADALVGGVLGACATAAADGVGRPSGFSVIGD